MSRQPYPCPRGDDGCGEWHTACAAHNRAGRPCGAQPLVGTEPPRCRNHAGRSAEVIRAQHEAQQNAVRLFRARQAAAQREGLVEYVDPLEELHRLAGEVLMWRDVCRELVGALPELRYRAGAAGEQVRAEVGLYERSLERAEKLLADLVRLGIEERLVKLNQARAAVIERVIDGVLYDLGHDPYDPGVAAIVERNFATVLAGSPATSEAVPS